ncbi:MAG: hypothetical protein KAV00_16860, partial [Phycisphaerae bacterium]|nr:hypothetical protein [Phycisphaerae bacterium]
MNESRVSFRIAVPQWETEERLEGLYRLFKEYAGATDEIAFFTGYTHPPTPLEVFRPRMDRLKEIMPRFRDLGMTAGINVLATIGHLEENLDNSLSEPWQRLMAPDGAVCRGCYCPSDENMQAYITAIYESAALANPDFIWIDDDVRLYGHDPVLCGCFCDKCLAIFSSETGQEWTRDKLLAVLNSDSLDEKLDFRRKWLEHNRQLIDGIMSLVEKAAHGIDKNLALGFMTGDRYYEGYDFSRWADTLKGSHNAPVMWRPGEGFYEDKIPSDLVKKADAMGRQASMLPDYVTDIQSEIENFPYHRLKKSFHITVLEAATDLAAGSTGTAFNILSMFDEPLDEYAPFLDRIQAARPFYDLVVSTFQRRPCEGLWPAWNKDAFVLQRLEGGWFQRSMELVYSCGGGQHELFEIGIPCAYSREGAKVAAFGGNAPLAFDKEE